MNDGGAFHSEKDQSNSNADGKNLKGADDDWAPQPHPKRDQTSKLLRSGIGRGYQSETKTKIEVQGWIEDVGGIRKRKQGCSFDFTVSKIFFF